MPTLNRFPLLGLWAKEAARRLGYTKAESEALGHAYAVLYAIRARGTTRRPAESEGEAAPHPAQPAQQPTPTEQLSFGGDKLDVTRDARGKVQGLVGGGKPQTAATYRSNVAVKFPPGYYEKLERSFRELLKQYPPCTLNSRLIYDLYDQWKKSCGVGRNVDLDQLIAWCNQRAAAAPRGKKPTRGVSRRARK
jgi:hypothetical protein